MLPPVSFTHQIDVPQVVFLLFALFFAGLVYHLRQEDKREGYPLESDRTELSGGRVEVVGFPPMPKPKAFLRKFGDTIYAPGPRLEREVAATPAHRFPGAPLVPTGDPLVDGVGPASYALKEEVPDPAWDGSPKIRPLRIADDYHVEKTEPPVVGMTVETRDGVTVGIVRDVWVELPEYFARYLEVEVAGSPGLRPVLLPIAFTDIVTRKRKVIAESVSSRQFARVPAIADRNQITKREEDRINAYFAGGYLYKDEPERASA